MNTELIEQRSIEWHECRWGKIGGTGVAELMGTKATNAKVINRLIAQQNETFQYQEGYTNDAMQRGIDMEPIAKCYLEELTGITFDDRGWIQSEVDILGLSPDGLSPCRKFACEIKCPQMEAHTEYLLADTIPAKYYWQCINYFAAIPELERLYFMSYRPECKAPHFLKIINRGYVVKFKSNDWTADYAAERIIETAKLASRKIKEACEIINKKLEF